MKNKILTIRVALLVLLLNAGSLLTIATSSGEQPTPVEAFELALSAYQPVSVENAQLAEDPASFESLYPDDQASSSVRQTSRQDAE